MPGHCGADPDAAAGARRDSRGPEREGRFDTVCDGTGEEASGDVRQE